MVYETDFYTVRRPYTRPTITSYSVTGYRPCVWRTTQISPLGAHSKVRLSVLLGELNRIHNRPRMHLGYVPTEDFLNSRPLVDFDDKTKYIRAEADKLLRYIYVPVPHQKLAPKITTSYDRLTSNGIIPYSRTGRNISNDIINMSYYPEPTRSTIGRGHLACITYAGGRGYPRRKHLFSDEYRDIGDEIKVRSYYNKNIHHSNRIDEALALPTGFASRLFRTEWKPYSVLEAEKKANKTMKIKRSETSKTEKMEKSADVENKQLSNEKRFEEEISKKTKSDESKKIVEDKVSEPVLKKSESVIEDKPKLKKESKTKSIEKSGESESTKKVIQSKSVKEEKEIAVVPKKTTDIKCEQVKTEEKKSTPAKTAEREDADHKKLADNKSKEESKKVETKKPTIQKSESVEVKGMAKVDEVEKLPQKKEIVAEMKPEVKLEEKKVEEKPEVKNVEEKPQVKVEVKNVEEKPEVKPEVVEEKPQVKPEVVEEKPQVKPEEGLEMKSEEKLEVKTPEEKPQVTLEETQLVKPEEKTDEKPEVVKPEMKLQEKSEELPVKESDKILEEIKTTQLNVELEIKPTIEQGQPIIEEIENKSVEVEKDIKIVAAETNVESENQKLVIEEIPMKQCQESIIAEVKDENNLELSQQKVIIEGTQQIIHESANGQTTVEIIETKQSIITSQTSSATLITNSNTDTIIPDDTQPIIEEPLTPEDTTINNPMIE